MGHKMIKISTGPSRMWSQLSNWGKLKVHVPPKKEPRINKSQNRTNVEILIIL